MRILIGAAVGLAIGFVVGFIAHNAGMYVSSGLHNTLMVGGAAIGAVIGFLKAKKPGK